MTDPLAQFLRFLTLDRRYSTHTVQNYSRDIQKVLDFCTAHNHSILTLSPKLCRQFLMDLNQCVPTPSSSTVSRLISANRSFFKYLMIVGLTDTNPWEFIRLPKKEQLLPKVLFKRELHQFLDSLPTNSGEQIRLKAICELIYAAGLRISECLSSNLDDLNLADGEIRVLGKGQKIRVGYFGETAKHWLSRYIQDVRSKWVRSDRKSVFLNQRGGRLSARSVQRDLKQAATAAGLTVMPTPHSLRHSFATQLYNGGADLRSVQELLGHQHLTTTQIYTHISDEKLENTYFFAHPRARKRGAI